MERNTYIGSSEVAAVLGLSKWATPVDVYMRKIGETRPPELRDRNRERILRRGTLMEPVVVEMLIAESPITIAKRSTPANPNRIADPECEFLAAEIDFEWQVTPEMVEWLRQEWRIEVPAELIGTTQNGEVKTVHPFAAGIFGEVGSDEVPIEYAAQALHGQMVSGRQLTLFPVLVGSDNLLLYAVHRDDAVIAGIRDKLIRFWLDNVQARVPPAPIKIPDIYRLLRKDLPTKIEATPEVAAHITSLRALKSRESALKEAIEVLQFEIGEFLLGAQPPEGAKAKDKGKHVITINGENAMWVSTETQERIDNDALREQQPEVARQFTKTITFNKFNLSRKKL